MAVISINESVNEPSIEAEPDANHAQVLAAIIKLTITMVTMLDVLTQNS
ncbi:hypothetical protein P4S68_17585 [Pseudoalteromonas sp. Hal099]